MNKKLPYFTSHFPTVCPGPTWSGSVTGSAGAAQIADPGEDRMWKGT